ncbi:Mariner Mos1 transposase [Eumeta japonica]|uniref:Mariner Mos1 transposase n=1 Tax=Eumeta variegata TaxID=151549 RepID=A0A4C1SWE7_EUMVA|nr:Mariner Mos1 transposase [Eumeta japonica]
MENQQQDANNDPAVRVEQKSRLPTDIWVLCKSKTYPGLLYYFNKATGEAMWSMDFEFSHNYPEPQVPPSKSQYSLESPSSSHVYNKQIINNKFSRNPYPWSTFGNVTFPNYLAHPISNQFSYNFPEVHFNQNAWAIPANQPVFVGPAVSIPNEKHSFNLYHNDEIAVQKTSISLSDRFKNLGSGVDQVSRKIEIPRIDKSNPRFGKSFRHKPENSTRNINEEDASNKLHYNDLRLMLVAKRRKSVDVSEMKNENEESDVDTEYNNENDLEENQENITMKMTGLKVSNPITPEVSTSSLPFRKKVTFDSLDIKDTKSNTMEEEINSENMYEDDMDLHGTLPQIDVTPLKRLSKPNDRNDLWFIVVDTCVLLSNLFFVNMLVKSDSKCRMMIPYRVHDELESQCSDMFRNHTLRTVGMAQRARRYISKELNARTSVVAQTAVEAEDRNINCPKEDDDILNCCLQLASQSFHVLGVVYYELLNPSETITETRYQTRLIRLSQAVKEKRPQYYSRHDKIILLYDSSTTTCRRAVYIAPSDYHLLWSMAHALSEQRFTSYEDTKNWVDLWIASKIKSSSDLESERCLKNGKK